MRPAYPTTVDINEETGMLELMSSQPADANAADEGVAKLQMVMEMDMQTWKVRLDGCLFDTCTCTLR
jgi:hypothetical protein